MNLLVTGAFGWTEDELNVLRSMGHQVVFVQQERDDLPCDPSWVEGVIGNGLFLSHPIESFGNLRYIQLTSAGFDRVPMDYVREKQIEIHNARGVYSIPMAEFAISGVLQLYKQSKYFYDRQRARVWEKNRNLLELEGRTVCIVGCGSVGTECAKRFAAFDCRVIGVDLCPYENRLYAEMVSLDYLDEKLGESDIVVLTLPLTEQTTHLFAKERFSRIKNGSVLVNIARGAVVETDALLAALHDKLYGAVLDVFEEEPLPEQSPLWDMEHVILMPHNSFVGDGNRKRLAEVILKNLEQCRV